MPPKKSSVQRQLKEGVSKATKTGDINVSKANGGEDDNTFSDKPRRSQRNAQKKGSDNGAQEQNGAEQGAPPTKKRKTNTSQSNGDAGGGKIGSKHDKADAPAQQGSKQRLPQKGQKAYWKAMPGWVDGEVLEIVTTQKNIDGHHVKGTEDEPRIVLKSTKSGKTCIHKPDNCYFDD